MEGRCLFEDGDLQKPDLEVSRILKSSSIWDLILFKTMIDLKEKQGLINQLLSAIDIIHISLGSLLHECLTPMEEFSNDDEEEYCVVHPDLARLVGFPETTKMKLRQNISSKYASLFKNLRLLENASERSPSNHSDDDLEEDFDTYNSHSEGDLSSKVKVELEEFEEEEDDMKESETNKSGRKKRKPPNKASIDNSQSEESEHSLKCTKCHKVYSSKNNVRRHMKKCLSNSDEKLKVKFPDFVCAFCKASYSTFLGFKNHVNITCLKKPEKPSGFLCDKCKVYIFQPPGTEHPCGPYFNCDRCTFKCYNENHFRQHYRLVHLNVGTIYCCEVCGKTFDSKNRLGNHLVVHTKERSFLCTECGKGFGRKSVLDVHMSVHFSKNVPCNICGKIFAHSNLVRKHVAAQHPKDGILTRESCPHCSSSFRSKFYLIKHIRHKHGISDAKLSGS